MIPDELIIMRRNYNKAHQFLKDPSHLKLNSSSCLLETYMEAGGGGGGGRCLN